MAAIPLAREIPSIVNFPPPIAAVEYNTIPSNEDVFQETKHVIGVMRGLDLGLGVTADDCGDRITRHHMVVARRAGQGAAPVWLDNLRIELGANMGELRADMGELRAQMGELGAHVRQLAANVDQLLGVTLQQTATSANHGYKQANRRLSDHTDHLFPLRKVVPGTPLFPPGFAPHGYQMRVFDNAPQVNETPADHGIGFPVAVHDLSGIKRAKILDLSVFYNDDFGIVRGDRRSVMAAKFASFVGR